MIRGDGAACCCCRWSRVKSQRGACTEKIFPVNAESCSALRCFTAVATSPFWLGTSENGVSRKRVSDNIHLSIMSTSSKQTHTTGSFYNAGTDVSS